MKSIFKLLLGIVFGGFLMAAGAVQADGLPYDIEGSADHPSTFTIKVKNNTTHLVGLNAVMEGAGDELLGENDFRMQDGQLIQPGGEDTSVASYDMVSALVSLVALDADSAGRGLMALADFVVMPQVCSDCELMTKVMHCGAGLTCEVTSTGVDEITLTVSDAVVNVDNNNVIPAPLSDGIDGVASHHDDEVLVSDEFDGVTE